MRTPLKLATLGAAAVILTVGAAPILTSAADHLDAPSLGSLSVGSLQGDRDINDLYVFQGDNPNKTVIALDTNPAAGLLAPATYGSNVRYRINVDTNGDAVADTTFDVTFGAPGSGPGSKQTLTVMKNGVVIGTGKTGNANQLTDGGKVFAGLRSDPFFFDLLGFRGSLGLGGSDRLCDGRVHPDFFANLNTLAIVLEVPDSELGTTIGVWATTAVWDGSSWSQRDQMGRPAINTVFNHTAQDKEDFNVTAPADQRTAFGGKFRTNVIDTLTSFGWDAPTAGAIADFLLPDVVTYDTRTVANGAAFNGRALQDDVIDAELAVTTHNNVTSDCVPAHTDYLSSFPYLGLPH